MDLVILSEKGDSQEALQKLDLAAASGEQLDVLMFSDPASYAQRVGLGMVAPLDEFIAEEGYTVTEEYKVNTMLDGKYYALPGKFNPWYVLLNKDHLDEAGLAGADGLDMGRLHRICETVDDRRRCTKRYGTYFHGPQNGGWMEYPEAALAISRRIRNLFKPDGSSNLDRSDVPQNARTAMENGEGRQIGDPLRRYAVAKAALPHAIFQPVRQHDPDRQLDEHRTRRHGAEPA